MDKGEKLKNISIVTTLKYFILCTMIIVQSSCQVTKKNAWCDPYDTFCMFSEGNEVRVSSLSEAQLKCSEIKNDSWPVELGDERVKEVFIEFIKNHSISNVILNAFNRNGNWYWKTSNISVAGSETEDEKGIVLYYNISACFSNYSVVCITNCKANWTFFNQTKLNPPVERTAIHELQINSLEKCKEFCEKHVNCSSIDWTYASQFHGCWIHTYPYNNSKRGSTNGTSHHIVDRTVKSVERCIGQTTSQKNDSETQNQTMNPIFPILTIVLISAVFIPIVIWFKRRKYPVSQPSQQSGDRNRNNCEREKDINVAPKRYLGPGGDTYTDVNYVNFKSNLDRRNAM